ncbi:MAG TPA: 3-methyl-2-oxobutanoate hydroxymethyltransferase, partial [Pseudobdellovibrionaceae bacterium]|nr:3-methyl-2-oxobutanoate hydroxymethyltransferase [Pseudobdellovibrionaceae bacterium]
CYAVVLECVPSHLAAKITKELAIPTIGIGAGVDCDGQVLVLQDLLGMNLDMRPKFVRKYVDGADLIKTAINHFHEDVQSKEFPSEKEAYK